MGITPELKTRITEHFYYYSEFNQEHPTEDKNDYYDPPLNETSMYMDDENELRTKIRDEIFFIDQYFLESSVAGKVTVPRVEEKEINKTTFKDGRAGFGIQFNTVFYITSVLQRSMAHRYNLEVMNQKPAGDVILSVNGKPTLGMPIAELSAMIQSRPSVQFVIDQKDSMGPRKLVMHRDFPDETLGVQLATVLMITDLMAESEAIEKLSIGDYIIKLNDIPTMDVSYDQAIGIIQSAKRRREYELKIKLQIEQSTIINKKY